MPFGCLITLPHSPQEDPMSILRTRTPQAVPATAATLEPFRLMRDFLRFSAS